MFERESRADGGLMFGFGQEGGGVADSIVVVCVASSIVVVVVIDANPAVVAVVMAARITCLEIERLPTPRTEDDGGPSLSRLTSSGPFSDALQGPP